MATEPRFRHFETVGSTNDIALELARAGEPEGLVITADSQTEGRGRRGRAWRDEPGQSIIMSAILRPAISASEMPKLSFVASLAVAEWLVAECGLTCELKWPNDVLVGDRKLAGILVELSLSSGKHAAVAGIGVNVNQRGFPDDLSESATSLAIETGQSYDVPALTKSLAGHVFAVYERFLASGFEGILADWRKYMWGIGTQVEVASEGRSLAEVIRGVDESGALLVEDARGRLHEIHAADAVRTMQ